jgi:peptidoglycan hydrolase-like protein with peptidoglycan-binding domain
VPKHIDGAVGFGGSNVFKNVTTVQYLLNCVPAPRGGPMPELVLDGIAGPKTIAAIRKFQTATFGSADGRVDPGAGTIHALHAFDPHPEQPIGPATEVKMPHPPGPFAKFGNLGKASGKLGTGRPGADPFPGGKSGPGFGPPGAGAKSGPGFGPPFPGGKSGPGFGPPGKGGTGGKLGW